MELFGEDNSDREGPPASVSAVTCAYERRLLSRAHVAVAKTKRKGEEDGLGCAGAMHIWADKEEKTGPAGEQFDCAGALVGRAWADSAQGDQVSSFFYFSFPVFLIYIYIYIQFQMDFK